MGVLVTQSRAAEFREALEKRVLVADGAMGTMLYAKRALVNRCLDELNLSLPALVRDVHREYVQAGAEILRTNTFGANGKRLRTFGFAEQTGRINHAGVRIAREVARGQAFVAGVIGPLGIRLEPLGDINCAEARACFREQIQALVEAGVDLLMLETFRDCRELREAVLAARETAGPEMVLAASVSVEDDGTLADGASTEGFTRLLDEWPVDIIGLNCSSGPRAILETIEKMSAYTGKPLSAMPGATGTYSPEYLAQYARRFVRSGVKILGGCCGTTPAHIQAIVDEVRNLVPAEAPIRSRDRQEAVPTPEALDRVPLAAKSHLGEKLAAGQFVTLVEIQPPRGTDVSLEIETTKRCKAAGVDAIVVVDSPRAALNAEVTCQLIQQQAGIETVLKVGGRARNIASIQSDLMGAHAVGVRNLLFRGDDAKASTSIANHLNQGLDSGGHAIGSRTALVLGVEAGLNSHMEAMVNAGAEYVVVQPVFDVDMLEAFLRDTEQYKLPVVAGIWPMASFRDGEYMLNELRVSIPPAYLARMSVAPEGVAIALEIVERVRSMVAGVRLSVPFGSYQIAVDVAEAMGPR